MSHSLRACLVTGYVPEVRPLPASLQTNSTSVFVREALIVREGKLVVGTVRPRDRGNRPSKLDGLQLTEPGQEANPKAIKKETSEYKELARLYTDRELHKGNRVVAEHISRSAVHHLQRELERVLTTDASRLSECDLAIIRDIVDDESLWAMDDNGRWWTSEAGRLLWRLMNHHKDFVGSILYYRAQSSHW